MSVEAASGGRDRLVSVEEAASVVARTTAYGGGRTESGRWGRPGMTRGQ
jgi:hypothetical protein